MFARRTLMQVATKLAIGLGALFLVGVLLAAIPNHRAPAVEGVSAAPEQEARGANHSFVPDKTRYHHGDSAKRNTTSPKTDSSTR